MLGFSAGTPSPLSQAVVHNGVIYCSGSGPLDAETLEIVSDDIAEQTQKALTNLLAVVEAAAARSRPSSRSTPTCATSPTSPSTTAFTAPSSKASSSCSARTTTESSPPRAGVLVEIECIAAVVSDE
ncbi:Rid family hydrolase [Streptosporangium lutulentum]